MKIHYCWFGGNSKSPLILKCIESWHRYCPGAEILEWNEKNFDIAMSRYTREAYEAKKWAFVSDYCRYYVLHKYGGIYLDTDVELIRPLTGLPENFVGFENGNFIASGLIRGAPRGDRLCKLMLDDYNNDMFFLPDGRLNTKTVCQRETSLLLQFGLKQNNTLQQVAGTTVFPTEFFCPLNSNTRILKVTKNTYSIHHYAASWCPEWTEYLSTTYAKWNKFLPSLWASLIARILCNLHFMGYKKTISKVVFRILGRFFFLSKSSH